VAYIDVDDFKAVNDQLGHSAGDRLLRTVAETMMDTLRVSDMVARMGGDEFVLLLPETDYDSSQGALKRIVQNLYLAVPRHNRAVTFSIGAVTFESPPASVDTLLRKADDVMYEVKSSGKNRIEHRVFSEVKIA
jgi:diguanylate cyclase (GGDEF)-like protein